MCPFQDAVSACGVMGCHSPIARVINSSLDCSFKLCLPSHSLSGVWLVLVVELRIELLGTSCTGFRVKIRFHFFRVNSQELNDRFVCELNCKETTRPFCRLALLAPSPQQCVKASVKHKLWSVYFISAFWQVCTGTALEC